MNRHPFPSDAWAAAYEAELNRCPDYADAARGWRHGAIVLALLPDPAAGLPDGFATWLDVEGGRCKGARVVTLAEAAEAPFQLTADHRQWRAIIEGRLDPIAGLLTRKIDLRGDLLVLLRFVRSAQAMVRCATRVPTRFDAERLSA